MSEDEVKIYVVASYCHTFIGRLISARAKVKFWDRYPGDNYSHISISLDPNLDRMMSFARKKIHNPLVSGLIRENIRTGMFALAAERGRIAVFELPVSRAQYAGLRAAMERDWARREELHYNFLGLILMLLISKGVTIRNRYFCTQWVADLLNEQELRYLNHRKSYEMRPFDVYGALKDYLVYEGPTWQYPLYGREDLVPNNYMIES